jgi:hypothetical protein
MTEPQRQQDRQRVERELAQVERDLNDPDFQFPDAMDYNIRRWESLLQNLARLNGC